MSNFAILRVQKLKSGGAVYHSLKHNFREQDTPNADPKRTPKNTHHHATNVADAIETFNQKLPDKVRKNAVYCIEYLITASPDKLNSMSKNEQDNYFNDALQWLKNKHGTDNVFCSSIHRDETTPHLCAYVIPLDENKKLNCRKYLGERNSLRDMQTDFFNKVASKYDLDRGIKGSKAKHQTIKHFYAHINNANQQYKQQSTTVVINGDDVTAKCKKKTFFSKTFEDKWDVAHRLSDQLNEQYKPIFARAALAEERERQKIAMMQRLECIEQIASSYLDIHKQLDYCHQKQFDDAVQKIGAELLADQYLEQQSKQWEQQLKQERKLELDLDDDGFSM